MLYGGSKGLVMWYYQDAFRDGAAYAPRGGLDQVVEEARGEGAAAAAAHDAAEKLRRAVAAAPVALGIEWASMEQVLEEKMVQMLKVAYTEAIFTAAQVSELVDMFEDSDWRVDVVALLMPRTVDMCNWNREVMNYVDDDELKTLEAKLGLLFYFTPPNPTGHYSLQLHNPLERVIVQKLVEISCEERKARRPGLGNADSTAINTSQKGDWDNWRNERIDLMDGAGMQVT
jgi:hypothetical protein